MWEYMQKREGIGVHVYVCICEGVIVWVCEKSMNH